MIMLPDSRRPLFHALTAADLRQENERCLIHQLDYIQYRTYHEGGLLCKHHVLVRPCSVASVCLHLPAVSVVEHRCRGYRRLQATKWGCLIGVVSWRLYHISFTF
jgi:hypothetical protein